MSWFNIQEQMAMYTSYILPFDIFFEFYRLFYILKILEQITQVFETWELLTKSWVDMFIGRFSSKDVRRLSGLEQIWETTIV